MAKIVKCKTCGAEIAKSAKVCPKCGAKQKKHIALGVILVIFGILLVSAAIGGGSDDGEPKTVVDSTPAQSQDNQKQLSILHQPRARTRTTTPPSRKKPHLALVSR